MKVAGRLSTTRWIQWWRRQWHGDTVLPLAVGVIEIIGTYFAGQSQPEHQTFDAAALLFIVASVAALIVRRKYPALVLIFVTVTILLYRLLNYPAGPIFLSLIVALFTAVIEKRRFVAWAVLAATFVLFPWLPYLLGNEPAPTSTELFGLTGWLLVMATAAEIVRAHLQRTAQAQRAREEEVRRRADEERLRIARELHDVLGHHISLISVQAGVALHLIDERPEQAQAALSVIRDASKEALRELRSVLDVLRQADEVPPRFPSPGLGSLDDLISRAADAGLHVRTEITGDLKGLPASVDLAAFRIIQEALTNVIRHSGETSSTIHVVRSEQELTLRIDNTVRNGVTRKGVAPGQGIRGMKERAAALGGSVEAGPCPGGFQVCARLPLDSRSSTPTEAE